MLVFVMLAAARSPAYPMMDGSCTEYAALKAEKVPLAHGAVLWIHQDKSYVWLCTAFAEKSPAVFDLGIETERIEAPLNLHGSAQLGEWAWDQEPPATPTDPSWGNTEGWTANVASHRFTATPEGGFKRDSQAAL